MWSKYDLTHSVISEFVEDWARKTGKKITSWNYDDNNSRKTIEIPHVHIYFCTAPLDTANDGRISMEKAILKGGAKSD